MRDFTFEITPGNFITKEANTVDEALKLVKADLAIKASLPELDNILFDYESGVPNIKGIRTKLGRVEVGPKMIEEQDSVLENIVGSKGFARNSKGQLAITPEGMENLGLTYKTRTLSDGSTLNLNTIIDERRLDLGGGDLADLSGAIGPVLGSVIALAPQRQILGRLFNFFAKRPRLERVSTAAIGSVAGESVEELMDFQEGFNLKDRSEQQANLIYEGTLGAAGQGVGELIGAGFKLLLGKNVPTDQQRLMYQIARKRSVADIKKLDESLGREATEREIKRAIKNGKVKLQSVGAAVSQQTLGRSLVGRSQAVAEQVLGSTREKNLAAYMFDELDDTLKNINAERASLISYIDESTKGSLDEQVQARLNTLISREQDVTNQLQKLFENIGEDIIDVGLYNQTLGREQIGAVIKKTVQDAYDAVTKEGGVQYNLVDKMFDQLGQPVKNVITDRIRYIRIPEMEQMIKQYKDSSDLWDANLGTEDVGNIVQTIERALSRMKKRADGGGDITLTQIRNDISELKDLESSIVMRGYKSKFLSDIINKFDNGHLPPKFRDSILTDFENEKIFMRKFDANGNPLFPEGRQPMLRKDEQKKIVDAVNNLRRTNAAYRDRIEVFDSIKMKKIIADARKVKGFDEYQVFDEVVKRGSDKDLGLLFRSLDEYDNYLNKIGKSSEATTANDLRISLQRKLFQDAFREATESGTAPINFTEFAKYINRFKGQYPEKLNILFNGKGEQVVEIVNQINKLNPRLKPQEIRSLVNSITRTEKGLFRSDAGMKFLDELENLAEASAARLRFQQNSVISNLPDIGVEEAVTKLFRPNSQTNIDILKKTVSPEVFGQIQKASMNKLLKKSIDINGKGKINDIFKPMNLKNALDSYGDETLDAMFGAETRKGLRQLQNTIDIATAGEVGRGGAAGTLVAAGIAVNALNIGMLPTIAGLAIMRNVFSRPTVLRFMTKTDKGSIMKTIEAFERAARQEGVRLIASSYQDAEALAEQELQNLGEEAEDSGIIEQARQIGSDLFEQAQEQTQDLQNQARSLRTTQVDFPEVEAVQQFGGLSPERIDFAERIAGRPIV
jgi:citrate lyase gamma subunit